MWLMVASICSVNIYYFGKIYNEGGTNDLSSSRAYTYAAVSLIIFIFAFLSFFMSFYLYYDEYKRIEHQDELEVGLIISSSEIGAINKTYKQTSSKLSNDIQMQMDDQVRSTIRVIKSKNNDIYSKELENQKLYNGMQNLYEKHSNLEDELDYTKQMYDELRSNIESSKNLEVKKEEQINDKDEESDVKKKEDKIPIPKKVSKKKEIIESSESEKSEDESVKKNKKNSKKTLLNNL